MKTLIFELFFSLCVLTCSVAARTLKAKSSPPESFIDVSYLKELEQGGFIKKLYGD